MLVNKYHTLDVAGEEPYEPDLFTPLQEKKPLSPAVQLSKMTCLCNKAKTNTKTSQTVLFVETHISLQNIITYRYVHMYSQQARKGKASVPYLYHISEDNCVCRGIMR